MSETFSKVEVITGVARRRRFPMDQKLAVVAETMQPGMSISYVARRHGLSPSRVFRWRRLMSEGGKEAIRADEDVVPASESPQARGPRPRARTSSGSQDHGGRDPQGGSRPRTDKKTDLAVAIAKSRRFPVKTVAATLQVARSNIIERRDGSRPQRGPQNRADDVDLVADIRRLVDQRPTYGYRRIAALLKRERRSAGRQPVNAKRIFRLMKKHGLLLQRYTGRRRPGEHDGKIITIRSNIRWCADAWLGRRLWRLLALRCLGPLAEFLLPALSLLIGDWP